MPSGDDSSAAAAASQKKRKRDAARKRQYRAKKKVCTAESESDDIRAANNRVQCGEAPETSAPAVRLKEEQHQHQKLYMRDYMRKYRARKKQKVADEESRSGDGARTTHDASLKTPVIAAPADMTLRDKMKRKRNADRMPQNRAAKKNRAGCKNDSEQKVHDSCSLGLHSTRSEIHDSPSLGPQSTQSVEGVHSTQAGVISVDDRLKDLADTILDKRGISEEELLLMAKGQNFTTHPHLALAYYYCCAGHPDAFVFNDEHVRENESVRERLVNALDSPPGIPEYARCQATATEADPSRCCIFACASCCEFLEGPHCSHVCLPLSRLPDSFRLSEEEYTTRYGHLSDDIVRNHAQILLQPDGSKYFLNPELVNDTDRIRLCSKCASNPRKSKFSLASGHEYGRCGSLPPLSAIAKNCISPARCFGFEISLSGKHCTGHAICFPSSGPQECAKVLPVTDIERKPRVTFIGPSEEWRKRKRLFRRLYELPSASIFSWLSVLQETHSFFRKKGIEIDTSQSEAEKLAMLEKAIENDVIVSDAAALHAVDDAVNSERYGNDVSSDAGDLDDVVVQQSAVLQPAVCQNDKVRSTIISAVLDVVGIEEDVAIVRREPDPIVEWDENGAMIAGAFPTLFMMGGEMLPSGSFSSDLIRHLMRYYDGRFEGSVTLIATLFNQLQRHAAVRKAARAATSHAKTLKKLGELANSADFKQSLVAAKNDPESPAAKRLNAGLLRIISVVGGTVPFSPFERAATRPKLAAMRILLASRSFGLLSLH